MVAVIKFGYVIAANFYVGTRQNVNKLKQKQKAGNQIYFSNLHFLLYQMLFQFFYFSPPQVAENGLPELQ